MRGLVVGGPFECPQDRPFDRLRANGFWRRACGGEWGMRWGTETPRASPLWIPAFSGMTRAEGPLRVPSGQASTGSGRTDLGGAPSVGRGGAMGDGDAPRLAPLDSFLRRNDARGGVQEGREVGTSPRLAPALGSRESGNDDGGCGGMRWREGLVSGWGPALAGGRFSNRPYDRGGTHEGGGDAGAAGGGGPPSSDLRTGPSTGSGRTDLGGAPSVGRGGAMGDGDAPRLAPLDSFLRRNDACGGG